MFHDDADVWPIIFSHLAMAPSQYRMAISHLYLVSELRTAQQNLPRRLGRHPLTSTHPEHAAHSWRISPTNVSVSISSELGPEVFLMKPLS